MRTPTGVSARVRPARARALCDGHFPGQPLVPGAALVGLMVELAGTLAGARPRIAAIERAVFRHRVGPESPILIAARLAPAASGARVQATVTCDGRAAAAATLRFEVA